MFGFQPAIIRVGGFDSSKTHPGQTETPLRVLSTYELAFFTKDGGTVYMNGQEYAIKKNCVLMGRPGDIRWTKLHFQCKSVHFLANDPALLPMLDLIPQFFEPADIDALLALFDQMHKAFNMEDRFSGIVSASRLCELLWQLYKSGGQEKRQRNRNPVRKAVRLIVEDYNQNISVEQMAEVCGWSASHFHKVFVKKMGMPPNRYLMLTRLSAAKTMLIAGERTVTQVAELCGFSSQAYFCRCLKKFTGLTPRQLRQKSKWEDEI